MDKKQDRGGNGHFQPEGPLANFTYWAKMRAWKETEVASLFRGLNPDFIWHHGNLSDWAEQYEAEIHGVLRLAISATNDRGFGWPYTPARWLAWAKERDIPVPPALEAEIVRWCDVSGSAGSAGHGRITGPGMAAKADSRLPDGARTAQEQDGVPCQKADDAAHAGTKPERELIAGGATLKPLPKLQARILRKADELWPDGQYPDRVKERNNAIIIAWPNGETRPHPKTFQRAFKARTNQDKPGQ